MGGELIEKEELYTADKKYLTELTCTLSAFIHNVPSLHWNSEPVSLFSRQAQLSKQPPPLLSSRCVSA